MNCITKICCASLVLMSISLGCEDPEEVPPVAEGKTVAPKPSSTKAQVAPLPPSSPPAILELLQSDDPEKRRQAGRMLGVLLKECRQRPLEKTPDAIEARAKLLADVLEKIAQLGPLATGAVPALEGILKQDGPFELKQHVLALLQKSGAADKRIGPTLAVVTRDPKLQAAAVQSIIQLKCSDPAAVKALGTALRNPELLQPSLEALRSLADETVVPASRFLMEVATSNQQPLETRIAAIEVIGKFSLAGVPDLSQLWNDDNPSIRKASMKLGIADGNFLVREKDPEVIAAAFEGLARQPIHPEYVARVLEQAIKQESLRTAVNQFLQAHPDKVVETLFCLFKSDSAMIRDYSIDQFAALANEEPVLTALKTTLEESEDPGLMTLAAIKLVEVPPDADLPELAESVSKWISHPKLKHQILGLLAKLGSDAVPTLIQLATDSRLESELKADVLGTLLTLPDVATSAEPLLRMQLKSDDLSTRHWAAVALVKLVHNHAEELELEVSPFLQEAMKSPDQYLLKATLEAIGERPKLGTAMSSDILVALKHTDPAVRTAAIIALTTIGSKDKIPGTLEALKKLAAEDPNADVQKQAVESVKQLTQ